MQFFSAGGTPDDKLVNTRVAAAASVEYIFDHVPCFIKRAREQPLLLFLLLFLFELRLARAAARRGTV